MREAQSIKRKQVECFRIKNTMLETLFSIAHIRHRRSKQLKIKTEVKYNQTKAQR